MFKAGVRAFEGYSERITPFGWLEHNILLYEGCTACVSTWKFSSGAAPCGWAAETQTSAQTTPTMRPATVQKRPSRRFKIVLLILLTSARSTLETSAVSSCPPCTLAILCYGPSPTTQLSRLTIHTYAKKPLHPPAYAHSTLSFPLGEWPDAGLLDNRHLSSTCTPLSRLPDYHLGKRDFAPLSLLSSRIHSFICEAFEAARRNCTLEVFGIAHYARRNWWRASVYGRLFCIVGSKRRRLAGSKTVTPSQTP